jgi:serine/threonine protein kinase
MTDPEPKTPTLTFQPTDLNPIEQTLTDTAKKDTQTDAHLIPINNGAFGCIFYPGIQCNGTIETRHYITKIQKQTHVTENEQYISQKIRDHISGYRNYFAPIMKQCPVQITKKYVDDIKKCDLFKEETLLTFQKKQYVSNKIRYLGTRTLKTYLFDIASGKVDPREPRKHSMGIFFWSTLLRTHVRLLDAVRRLLKIDVIHLDIKYGNVMIDPDTRNPVLIDFGISVDHSKLVSSPPTSKDTSSYSTRAFYIYDTYTAWCFDIFLCNYIVHRIRLDKDDSKVSTKEEIESILKEFQYGNSQKYPDQTKTRNDIFSVSIVSSEKIQAFRDRMVSEFASRPWKEIYEQCVQTNYSTWDNYSIATMYLGMLDMLNNNKREAFTQIETASSSASSSSNSSTILDEYMKIIESIVYSPTKTRPGIKETRAQLRRLQKRL